MTKELEQSIIKTLAYFDIADYPLTAEELFRYLWQPPRLSYEDFLVRLPNCGGYEQKYGYYFLPGRELIIEKRRERSLESALKLKRARTAAGFIAAVPFLRAIFVCNSVGSEQARTGSDIDFFIVTTARRIWIVRFFTNLILRIFGLRTYGRKRQNRICLSFFVDTDHLNLSPYKICDNDIHFIYWLHQMQPLYDLGNWHEKFLLANIWTDQFVPHIKSGGSLVLGFAVYNSPVGRIWKSVWEKMWGTPYGDLVENQAKQLQAQKSKIKIFIEKKQTAPSQGIIIADGVIKLHENDTRQDYLNKWLQRIKELGL